MPAICGRRELHKSTINRFHEERVFCMPMWHRIICEVYIFDSNHEFDLVSQSFLSSYSILFQSYHCNERTNSGFEFWTNHFYSRSMHLLEGSWYWVRDKLGYMNFSNWNQLHILEEINIISSSYCLYYVCLLEIYQCSHMI